MYIHLIIDTGAKFTALDICVFLWETVLSAHKDFYCSQFNCGVHI